VRKPCDHGKGELRGARLEWKEPQYGNRCIGSDKIASLKSIIPSNYMDIAENRDARRKPCPIDENRLH
jgi:hypothetical protein